MSEHTHCSVCRSDFIIIITYYIGPDSPSPQSEWEVGVVRKHTEVADAGWDHVGQPGGIVGMVNSGGETSGSGWSAG